jgi:hypothetical protein
MLKSSLLRLEDGWGNGLYGPLVGAEANPPNEFGGCVCRCGLKPITRSKAGSRLQPASGEPEQLPQVSLSCPFGAS